MEKKNTVLLTGIAVATLLVAVVGATFAYFSATVTNENNTTTVLKAANLGITFTGGKEIPATGSQEVIIPGWSNEKTFTVKNTSDYDMAYDIIMHNTTNTFERKQDLTWTLTATTTGNGSVEKYDLDHYTKVDDSANRSALNGTNGTLPATSEVGGQPYTLARVYIPANTTQSFTLTVAYANAMNGTTPVDQNIDQNKDFQTTVDIQALGIDPGTLNSGN